MNELTLEQRKDKWKEITHQISLLEDEIKSLKKLLSTLNLKEVASYSQQEPVWVEINLSIHRTPIKIPVRVSSWMPGDSSWYELPHGEYKVMVEGSDKVFKANYGRTYKGDGHNPPEYGFTGVSGKVTHVLVHPVKSEVELVDNWSWEPSSEQKMEIHNILNDMN